MKKVGRRRIFTRIISLFLILSSFILFIFGRKNILGFAVAEPQATQLNYFVAVVLLIIGLLVLLGENLVERVRKTPIAPSESPFWKNLGPFRGKIKKYGHGKELKYYVWDYTHGSHIEVFNRKKKHIGEANPVTGEIDYSKIDPKKYIDIQ